MYVPWQVNTLMTIFWHAIGIALLQTVKWIEIWKMNCLLRFFVTAVCFLCHFHFILRKRKKEVWIAVTSAHQKQNFLEHFCVEKCEEIVIQFGSLWYCCNFDRTWLLSVFSHPHNLTSLVQRFCLLIKNTWLLSDNQQWKK